MRGADFYMIFLESWTQNVVKWVFQEVNFRRMDSKRILEFQILDCNYHSMFLGLGILQSPFSDSEKFYYIVPRTETFTLYAVTNCR